jgi:hypothetical protein
MGPMVGHCFTTQSAVSKTLGVSAITLDRSILVELPIHVKKNANEMVETQLLAIDRASIYQKSVDQSNVANRKKSELLQLLSFVSFFDFFLIFFRAGVTPVRFPFWCFVGGPVYKLRLRRPRELGDRAFLDGSNSPERKRCTHPPAA